MGWKDLFKSKATKAKPDPRLRWFGKLPTYADYYSSPTDEDWAVEFNDWVLKGFETYLGRMREGSHVPRVPSAACAVRLPKSGMTVFASLQDYGGDMRGRSFPLCFYVGVPSGQWTGPTSDRVGPALRLLRDLTDLRDEVFRFCNSPGRFDATFGGRELDLRGIDDETTDESWLRGAKALSLAEWFATARQCLKIDDLNAWYRRVDAWGENIAHLESEEFGPTLRFPLVMAQPFDVQVGGWLRWLGQRMDLGSRLLSLMMCRGADNGTGQLTVLARDVVPEDFLLLTSAAGTLAYLDDLCALTGAAASEGPPAGGAVSVPVPADRPAESVPEAWAGFIGATAGP